MELRVDQERSPERPAAHSALFPPRRVTRAPHLQFPRRKDLALAADGLADQARRRKSPSSHRMLGVRLILCERFCVVDILNFLEALKNKTILGKSLSARRDAVGFEDHLVSLHT